MQKDTRRTAPPQPAATQLGASARRPTDNNDGMVLAIGDNGEELIPAAEAVSISVVPNVTAPWGGEGTPIIPATLRAFRVWSELRVTRLIRVRLRAPWVYVSLRSDCGKKVTCYVRHARDVGDPYFNHLKPRARIRMLDALDRAAALARTATSPPR